MGLHLALWLGLAVGHQGAAQQQRSHALRGGSIINTSDAAPAPSPAAAGELAVHCTGDAVNDTAALAAANAASVEGSAIIIYGGCLTSQTFVLRSGRTYLGQGRANTGITMSPGANLPAVVASDSWMDNATYTGTPVHLAHLYIDGNKKANPLGGHALVLRSWDTVVEDLQITNAAADGIRLTSVGAGGAGSKTTQVNGRISNIFVEASGGDGIRVEEGPKSNACTDWSLLDSWVAGSGKSAINMDNSAGWQIRGNHVYGVRQHAIFASNCFGTTIADNFIEDFGGDGSNASLAKADGETTFWGIACTVQGGAASVIRGNKVFRFGSTKHVPAKGTRYAFIGSSQVNYRMGVLNVVGNVVRGGNTSSDVGLVYEAGAACPPVAHHSGANPGGLAAEPCGLTVASSTNLIMDVGTQRVLGAGVTLADTLRRKSDDDAAHCLWRTNGPPPPPPPFLAARGGAPWPAAAQAISQNDGSRIHELKTDDQQADNDAAPCPCDPSGQLCKSLSPQPTYKREVIAYHVGTAGGVTSDTTTGREWQTYDLQKATALALFTPLTPKLLCKAHKLGVRILDWTNFVGSQNPNPFNNPNMLLDPAKIKMWVANSVAALVSHGYDGAVLDIEISTYGAMRKGLVDAVCLFKRELQAAIPGAILTFNTAYYIQGNQYNFTQIANCVDFIMPEVGNSAWKYNASATRIPYGCGPDAGECKAGAFNPLDSMADEFASYIAAGIPPSKIAPLFQW